jgi:hypothetical protein
MNKVTLERKYELEMEKLVKKQDEFEGIVMHSGSNRSAHGGGGSNHHLPRVTPIANGEVLAVVPDDATLEVMRDWEVVKAGLKRNGDDGPSELFVFKSTDGKGFLIRVYKHQRPMLHVSVSGLGGGTAVAKGRPFQGPLFFALLSHAISEHLADSR